MTEDISVAGTDAVVEAPPSRRDQRGMVSAEWAVGIIAAIAIAGVLLGIVTSGPVHDALLKFILMVIHSFSGFLQWDRGEPRRVGDRDVAGNQSAGRTGHGDGRTGCHHLGGLGRADHDVLGDLSGGYPAPLCRRCGRGRPSGSPRGYDGGRQG